MAADRLIGIGDVHGNLEALEDILEAVDEEHGVLTKARGSLRRDVVMVFTGDYIDRRPHSLGVIKRLWKLGEGPGRLITLFGNHELMALEDLDEARRIQKSSSSYPVKDYEKSTDHGGNGGGEFIREFGRSQHEAMASYVRRMAKTGDVGRWLRSLSFSFRTRFHGRTVLFTHADIPTHLQKRHELDAYVRRLNARRKLSSRRFGTAAKWGLGDDSLFWCRKFARLRKRGLSEAGRICDDLRVDYVVTGHTTNNDIKSYGGRIFDIDVGMGYGHLARALVFSKTGVTGLSADGRRKQYIEY